MNGKRSAAKEPQTISSEGTANDQQQNERISQ